ncbi:MAG: BadF/BadG/BcrA/BcrD ATPase family protein [Pseudomonadota bacterium]
MSATFYLGVDGGGTRCRARVESEDGRVLGEGLAGPASMRFGFEAARASVMAATRQAFERASLGEDAFARTYAGIGLAGTGQLGARAALEAWRHPFAGAWFEGDGYLALLGAFGGDEGGVVIAGTGSIGLTFHGKTIRVGGYGFPVSDEGSGADIGLNALRYVLRSLDGRAAPSAFSQAVLARFADDAAQVTAWMETATPTDFATLAPLVVQHATTDPAARALMQDAAARIAELIDALVQHGAPRIALLGGLADAIKPHLTPETAAHLVAPQADALSGGILLAKERRALV